MRQPSTGRILATWEANRGEVVSDWIDGIPVANPNGAWVEVYFYPEDQANIELSIINAVAGTSFGWIGPGACRVIELE